jgi:FkbM family methyltransferase
VVVEPNTDLVPLIERNRERNGASFEVLNVAYASEGGIVDLNVPEDFWLASLHPVDGEHDTISTPATDLRTLVDQYGLSDVALVVDVEGSEVDLLENELDVVESHCRLLVVEFHDDAGEHTDSSSRVTAVRDSLERRSFELLDERDGVAAYRPPASPNGQP